MTGVRLVWPGGEHLFRLRLGELRALQKNCDAGPEQVLNRLRLGQWRVDDLIEPIRLGLIGGGDVTESEAGPMVVRLMGLHPLAEFKLAAISVLIDALLGWEDEPAGKPGAGVATDASASPASTETAR